MNSPVQFRLLLLAISAGLSLPPAVHATEYYVAPTGNDTNPGNSVGQPFRTLTRATRELKPGDTCWLRGGVYREGVTLTHSGEKDRPIVFAAFHHEPVILDGSDLVDATWTKGEGKIWKAQVAGTVDAVFCDGKMMVEARWPNCTWGDNWQPDKKWSLTDEGSKLGALQSSALAQSGQDLSGGIVYMKLSKGNSCYTRRILSHQAGSAVVTWDASGLPSGPPMREWREDAMPVRIEKFGLAKNRFFVVAAGALDAPEEWWHDDAKHELRFILPDGGDPSGHAISVKRRTAAFAGEKLTDLVFRDLVFRGCNLRFASSNRLRIESCHFIYPSTLREFPDETHFKRDYQTLWLQGDDNVVEHCEISWAFNGGLEIEGRGNRVEDCVVHDVNLDGCHPGPGISIKGTPAPTDGSGPKEINIVRRCTIYNCGGVAIYAFGHGPALVDHNHLFNGGLYCVDVSLFYIPTGDLMAGTVVDHNWIHDQHGLGFRVDQEGRDITFHHNLVWNVVAGCKFEGFLLRGYNNTVLADNPMSPFMVVFDPGTTADDLAHWRIQNNVAYAFIDRLSLRVTQGVARIRPLESHPGTIDHNFVIPKGGAADVFMDFANDDFRPKPHGPLDHTGLFVQGITADQATTPSLGALEVGVDPWVPGAKWLNDKLTVPASPRAASELARSLRPSTLVMDRGAQQDVAQ